MQDDDRWLTIDEACAILKMTRSALAQLRYLGGGPTFSKPSPRVVRYRESDVYAWLEGGLRTTTAEAA